MKNTSKLLATLAGIAMLLAPAGAALANPQVLAPTSQTATATTSPAYMTPGLATSTVTYDAYAASVTQKFKPSTVGLALQFAASSTAGVLKVSEEFSNDGIDWYQNYLIDPNLIGTTTSPLGFVNPNSFQYKFASTTPGGAAVTNANSATSTLFTILPSPTRFMRVILSITGGPGAVWAQLVPVKELQ